MFTGLVFLSPGSAKAQDADYRTAITGGVAEFDRGNFAEARALFQEAHRLQPNARTLRGMGQCSFELKDYVDAASLLKQALKDPRRPLTDSQRQEVQALLTQCRAFIGSYRVRLLPADSTVDVDGASWDTRTGPLMLGLGEHEISAEAPGFQRLVKRVQVRGGEQKELVMELKPALDDGVDPGPSSDGSGAGNAGVGSGDATGPGPVPWVLIAVGGATVLGGVITGVLARDSHGDIGKACDDGDASLCNRDDISSGKSLQTMTNILWGVGGALAATGVGLLFLLDDTPESPDYALSPYCSWDSCGVTMTGSL